MEVELKAMEKLVIGNHALKDWDRLESWIHGICIVTFDLELGQAIEHVYPSHVELSEQDKTNICYLAFPDSNSGVMGDSQFHFRIRTSTTTTSAVPTLMHEEFNKRCPTTILGDRNYLFGFVYFRQVKDASIRRGYYQKSLIILSHYPLISLFNHVTNVVARKFFETGEVSLEVATHDINQWPLPLPGQNLQLPLLGHVFQAFLPSTSTRSVESGSETVSITSSVDATPCLSEIDLFSCLLPVIDHIDSLWEMILTAEPLVIMASTPTLSSATVQYLTSIIYPLGFCADYRPFYTIHDSDFKDITNSNSNALPNIILGVTNPFFSKALSHWPNIVKIQLQEKIAGHPSKKMSKFKLDSKPGVYSNNKPLLEKDSKFIKRILKGVQLKRPVEVQSALIRRHFLELTQTFMIPLERYMASLMPLAKNISPYRAAPKVKPFNPDDFIKSLDNCGPQLTCTIKGDWEALYRRFFKSPNFVGWYNNRTKEVSRKLETLHLESLAESKIEHWLRDKEEVQLVDMVLRIRNKLDDKSLILPDIVMERLQSHIEVILQNLPADLKTMMIK